MRNPIYIIIIMSVICFGCASSRNTDMQKQVDYSEYLNSLRKSIDSLNMQVNRQTSITTDKLSNLKLENKTVYYSIPDSTGKQYPVKESTTNINKEEQERRQVDETLLVSMQYLSARMDSLNAKINALTNEKEKVTELSWWDLHKEKVYLCIIVSFIIVWLVYKKRNK